MQRLILISGVLVVVAVLGMLGVGWYAGSYRPLHETVIKVNDREFDMNYYIKTLSFYASGQSSSYLSFLADEVVRIIERNELLRQGAAVQLGITVSDDAVDEVLGAYNPPLSKDYRDLVRANMLAQALQDEYFDKQVPVSAEQRHAWAMFLESESQVTDVRTRLEGGEGFSELAGELSLDDFSKEKKGDLDWRPKGVLSLPDLLGSSVAEEHIFSAQAGVLSEPVYDETKTKFVGYWLIKILERREDTGEAHLQAMLLPSNEQAEKISARLEAGEDFGKLAEEFSRLEGSKEDAGDLGWLTSGTMSAAFEEFAFNSNAEIGKLSEPIRDDTAVTTGGYWLLKVVGIEPDRKISDEDRDLLKAKALNDWVSALLANPENKVESYLDDQKKEWAILRVLSSQAGGIVQ